MTGAPKKRSVQILQTLEDDERSIYSGVAGYWCVSGAGDWSVIIRSLFRFEDNADDITPRGETNGHSSSESEVSSGRTDVDSDVASREKDNFSENEFATGYDEWTVGAGGAITALSDPEAEWEEMLVKLQSVLRAFGVKPTA